MIGPPTRPPLSFDDDFPYDPDAHPSWGDRLNWAKWKLKLKGGDVVRSDLDDALESYRHYMDGSGKPLEVDYDEAYREDSAIHTAVDNEIASARTDAERLVRESGRTSFSMTGDATSVTKLGGYPTTENWQKTLGDHQIWSSADVHVNGDTVTMTVTVHAEDRYNFNKGAADIATGAPDNENGRFATLGWAKAYDTHGRLTRTVTWHVGDPAHPTAGGGSDPQRDPGREDREDGRGSSAGDRPVVPDNNRDTGGPRVG